MKKYILLFCLFLFLVHGAEPVSGSTNSVKQSTNAVTNSIFVIAPYRYHGTWVFDEPRVGLSHEAFVEGIPQLIDKLAKDIPDADKGFRLLFSDAPFPKYSTKLVWRRKDIGGNWYYSEEFDAEGWLCPSLYKFFPQAPKEIYVKAEKKEEKR